MEDVKVSQTFTDFRGTEIYSVRLWDYETASTEGACAGTGIIQFPVHIYGRNASRYADRVEKWARSMANDGLRVRAIMGNLKHRMNERGISYDGSCGRGIV